jgi:hypothetical protein
MGHNAFDGGPLEEISAAEELRQERLYEEEEAYLESVIAEGPPTECS